MTSAPKRCALYARISVTTEESVSVDRQLQSCRKYAEARGWDVAGEFIDDGVSASVNRPEDRPGWSALLRADGFNAVIIWKVDRLARKVIDFLHADEALQARGAGLVAVEDPIDMTTPQGRAFAVMLAVFGEMEAAAIRARVVAARAHLAKEGRWAGGGVPYGYQPAPNPDGPGWILVQDPERAPWLAQIARRALDGTSVGAITAWLTDSGAPLSAQADKRRKSGSTAWNRQAVDGILRNPILAGMVPYNPGRGRGWRSSHESDVRRDGNGEPIIHPGLAVLTAEEYTQLRERLESRNTPQTRKRSERETTSPFLSRVARCDDCDRYMCRGTNQKRPVLYCPECRQTMSRAEFDPYLIRRLLRERGRMAYGTSTFRDHWAAAGSDDTARRDLLLTQLESLRIRRGVVGRRFDHDRVLLRWQQPAPQMAEPLG